MDKIAGRRAEQNLMMKLLQENKAQFLAVYGRRRVGKTFLIKSIYKQYISFYMTGLGNATTTQQLANFHSALKRVDKSTDADLAPHNWIEAFERLRDFLERSDKKKKVVFLDELPWLDTRQSDFMTALEHFWNSWASDRPDILLVVCGSAASWMINKLINNKGGLHNRVTKRIRLLPFTLGETEEFLQLKNINIDRYQIVQLYMALGGIPFYLDEIQPGNSAFQEIDRLCFAPGGILQSEYDNLYRSLFNSPERHIAIIEALGKKNKGLTRDELIADSGLSSGGNATKAISELEESGFISRVYPFGKKSKDSLYRLTDQYSLFYLKFMKSARVGGQRSWLSRIDSPAWSAWSGYAYENICFMHIEQIKKALGISGVYTEISSWQNPERTVQIDLLIDRRDHVVSLCEIKFSVRPYSITAAYRSKLQKKIWAFQETSKTRKAVFLVLITTHSLQENIHSTGFVQNVVTMEHLFAGE